MHKSAEKFVEDKIVPDPNVATVVIDLWQGYLDYCAANHLQHGKVWELMKAIDHAYDDVIKYGNSRKNGRSLVHYRGIRLL